MGGLLALWLTLSASPVVDAQARFDAGDFEGALAQVQAPSHDASQREVGAMHLLRARCLAALRRNAEIESALELALTADPTVALNENEASPALRATLERLRARLAGSIRIDSDPAGAAVRIDGALVGRAPVSQLLPVGKYRVSVLDANGAEADVRDVLIAPRQQLTVTLSTAPAKVAGQAPPAVNVAGADGSASSVEAALSVRGVVDPSAGVAFEAGAALLGKFWLVEVDGVLGGAGGLGIRAGARIAFLKGLLGAQLTADGVAFFAPAFAPGGGATLSFVVHPVSFLDLLLDGGARFVAAAPGYRQTYGLLGLTLRVRWPTGLDERFSL